LEIVQRVAQQISGAVEISRLNRQSAEATAALRDSESKLFDLFENAPIAYHEADADGTILRVNQTALNMFGYTEDEMVGRSIVDFLVESEEVGNNIEGFKHEVPTVASMWERTFIAKDGTFVPILVTVKVQTDARGKTIGQLATMQDMSELKRLEEQLLRAQKMDALGKLAGGIAHDFNNLLTGMMLQAGIARNAVSVDGPQAEAGLDEIVKIAKRASLLTRQLLTFSRSQMLNPIICQPNEMVTDMHLMLRRLIGEHIELVLLLDNKVGSISIDPSQFEQVLVNLVLNARDAVVDGGKITIKTATTPELPVKTGEPAPEEDTDKGYVVLTVADDGKGMTDEVKNRAFEPFFTTKEVGQGTGLGLATCYGIIAQSGGAMDLSSEAGVGTIFNIYLPIRIASPVRASQEPEMPMIGTGTETVLLVEDEPSVRRALAAVLSDSGYRVLEASNGHEALSVYHDPEASSADIVVTDVVMPLMGGRELSERLRAVDPSLKILFTSGYNEDQSNLLEGPEEITSFIHKPFLPNDLIADVRALLDRGGNGD
jgi:two-component system, cell cycle sensor histidine kinase and response regulator CckA